MKNQLNLHDKKQTKKELILSYFSQGVNEIKEIAKKVAARPSYVASTLQEEGLITGYFDLYTSTKHSMNVYSKPFAYHLGFKDEQKAQKSVALLDRYYKKFKKSKERGGQHHVLSLALIMLHRALWINKKREAKIFGNWIVNCINEEIAI